MVGTKSVALALLGLVQAEGIRPLAPSFKSFAEPAMVQEYKKMNPDVSPIKEAREKLGCHGNGPHGPEVESGTCQALCLFQDD